MDYIPFNIPIVGQDLPYHVIMSLKEVVDEVVKTW